MIPSTLKQTYLLPCPFPSATPRIPERHLAALSSVSHFVYTLHAWRVTYTSDIFDRPIVNPETKKDSTLSYNAQWPNRFKITKSKTLFFGSNAFIHWNWLTILAQFANQSLSFKDYSITDTKNKGIALTRLPQEHAERVSLQCWLAQWQPAGSVNARQLSSLLFRRLKSSRVLFDLQKRRSKVFQRNPFRIRIKWQVKRVKGLRYHGCIAVFGLRLVIPWQLSLCLSSFVRCSMVHGWNVWISFIDTSGSRWSCYADTDNAKVEIIRLCF